MKLKILFWAVTIVFALSSCSKDDDKPSTPDNNPPVLAANQSFTLSETAMAGQSFGTVQASDEDGDQLTFSISANDNDLFAISNAGALSVASGQSLDASNSPHTITVRVTDDTDTDSATITINVTEGSTTNEAPVMEDQGFEVDEDIADDVTIGKIIATDNDSENLTFSIKTNSEDLFEITADGVLSLIGGAHLDFESTASHVVTVSVSDMENSVDAQITIAVENVNEEPIFFSNQVFTVPENIGDDEIIGVIDVVDPEGGTIVFQKFGDESGIFVLNQAGELRLLDGESLDYESKTQYVFDLNINVDGELQKFHLSVTVNVTDIEPEIDLNAFITTWTVDDGESITIGTGPGVYDYTIDWGDDTAEEAYNVGNPNHMYAAAGTYTVVIKGDFPHIIMDNNPSATNLKSIEQWGNIQWQNFGFAFVNCNNMEYNATDAPDLSQVTNLWGMFYGCTSFNGDVSNWNVSTITSMGNMFGNTTVFNQDLGAWDISSVTEMVFMFDNSGLSPANYDATLLGWANYPNTPDDIIFGADGVYYCDEESRTVLEGKGWIITDEGVHASCQF